MSVIVWDGKTLAADRQATSESTGIKFTTDKLWLRTWGVIGGVGTPASVARLMEWYEKTPTPSAEGYPKKAGVLGVLVVYRYGEVVEYDETKHPELILDPFCAWGSGRAIAMGALAMGADAVTAVKIASEYHHECGKGVTAFPAPRRGQVDQPAPNPASVHELRLEAAQHSFESTSLKQQ